MYFYNTNKALFTFTWKYVKLLILEIGAKKIVPRFLLNGFIEV